MGDRIFWVTIPELHDPAIKISRRETAIATLRRVWRLRVRGGRVLVATPHGDLDASAAIADACACDDLDLEDSIDLGEYVLDHVHRHPKLAIVR